MRGRSSRRFYHLATVVASCLAAAALWACDEGREAGDPIYLGDTVHGSVKVLRNDGLPRTLTIVEEYAGDVVVTTEAVLDTDGFVVEAKWKRSAPAGTRTRTLERRALGLFLVEGGRSQKVGNLRLPVVLLSTASEVAREGAVQVLTLDAAETIAGRVRFDAGMIHVETESGILLSTVDAKGNRLGPGAFAIGRKPPSDVEPVRAKVARWERALVVGDVVEVSGVDLRDLSAVVTGQANAGHRHGARIRLTDVYDVTPPKKGEREPKLAFESDAAKVKNAFGRSGAATPAQDALYAVQRISEWLQRGESRSGPASALAALRSQVGDCDDATALFVAWMRARGHAARAVVGYRLADGVATPHAWAEYWTGDRWEAADAMWPAVGIIPANLRLFDGLGSALTIGRTLGSARFSIAARRPKMAPAKREQ